MAGGAIRRAGAWIALALLVAASLAGLSISALSLLARTSAGRRMVQAALVPLVDERIAGSLALGRIDLLPGGGIELGDLRILDPDGHLVLAVGRARFFLDLTAVHRRTIGVAVELDAPSVMLEQEPGGGVSLVRAFSPNRRAAKVARPPRERGAAEPRFRWTIDVSRLEIHGGKVRWVDVAGDTRLEAADLSLTGRGVLGAGGIRAALRLGGLMEEPLDEPIALDLVAAFERDALRVPVLEAKIGDTALSAVGEGDVSRRTGRVAVTRLFLDRAQSLALAPRAPRGADLGVGAFAESDGSLVTAAVRVDTTASGEHGGRSEAAIAMRFTAPKKAMGFDVALHGVDPSRLAAQLPPGEVTLVAHGAASGTRLADLRGHLVGSIARSRLRRGYITRARVVARARSGMIEVERITALAPGLFIDGNGRWREGGAVSGRLGAQARDLSAAERNLAALLGVKPQDVGGRARVDASLGGTSAAPSISAGIEAPFLRFGTMSAAGASLAFHAAGPPGEREGRLKGRIASLRRGSRQVARALSLRAAVSGQEATLAATAAVPRAGTEPYAFTARGHFGSRRESLVLSKLTIAWPGTRFALVHPAEIRLRGPNSEVLELAAGTQRIAASGGLGRRGALDARIDVTRLDLARLPPGLLPAEWAVAGELSLRARAAGTLARPEIEARFSIESGTFGALRAIAATGHGHWDGTARRVMASLSLSLAGGGAFDVRMDAPFPLAGRPAEPIDAKVSARGVPVDDVIATAGGGAHVAGNLSLDLALEGRVGAPVLEGGAALDDGVVEDLDELSAWVSLENKGDRLRVVGAGMLEGKSVVSLEAEAPFDLSRLLARPAVAFRRLRSTPLEASAKVTGLDLALVAGRAGAPEGIAGMLEAYVGLSGPLGSPRGRAAVDVSHGSWRGYRSISSHLDLALRGDEVAASGRVSVASDEALRFTASLGLPAERLGTMEAIRRAPLRVDAVVPSLALAGVAGREAPLTGTVKGRLSVSGTPGSPVASVDLDGAGIAIEGRSLGEAELNASYAGERGSAKLRLRPVTGGELRATLEVKAVLGLGAGGPRLSDAPAEISIAADALDLGFLPAAAPGVVRTASGKLYADVRAAGPLARLSPRGTIRTDDAALAITELGEWNGITLVVNMTADAIELSRLDVRHGKGRLSARGALRGMRSERASLDAHVTADAFTVSRAGMVLATIDTKLDLTGTYAARTLAVEARVARGVVRLPDRAPRTLQPLERRKDIVVTTRERPGRRGRTANRVRARPAAPAGPSAGEEPLTLAVHAVAPGQLFIRSDRPKVDVEIRADVTFRRTESGDYAEGSVEVVRGTVEPIAGRTFTIQNGRVQFTGGPPKAAMIDVEATYDNPTAKVTVNVAGPLGKPEIRLSSQPPLDESQIALLIATGQTSLQPGAGGVGTLSGEEAGKAALAALATQAFKNLVANKLPLDTVALDSGELRAGKYVTDRIYVGYARRFDADPAKGENEDEVRVEYRISPQWMFESRYGNAQSGSASLIWSRSY